MDVMAYRANRIAIEEDRLVTTLEHMSIGLPEAVEAVRKGPLQPFHALYQVRLRGLQA